jgi:dTMP kinase
MKDYLTDRGYEVFLTREPGGTRISEKVRDLLLDPVNSEMNCITEMMLYAAARAQLVAQVIKPAVAEGKAVICDRFIDSTYAYQGFGRGLDLKLLADINRVAVDGLMPDVTFFFDLSPEIALARRLRESKADRIEAEKMDFHMRVYNGYLRLAYLFPERIKPVDSDRNIDEISAEVRSILDGILRNG